MGDEEEVGYINYNMSHNSSKLVFFVDDYMTHHSTVRTREFKFVSSDNTKYL